MLIIRDAFLSDAAKIAHIQKVTWMNTYVNKEYDIQPQDIEAQDFENPTKILRNEEAIKGKSSWKLVVAELDGEVVGYCGISKGETANYQGGLYILPAYQGQGIGTALVKKAESYLEKGKPVECDVASFNENALSFWKKQGFEIVGTATYTFKTGKTFPLVKMKKLF